MKALKCLQALPVELRHCAVLADYDDGIVPLAESHDLSFYDAIYLHLALEEELTLATVDRKLQNAAREEGVVLLTEYVKK